MARKKRLQTIPEQTPILKPVPCGAVTRRMQKQMHTNHVEHEQETPVHQESKIVARQLSMSCESAWKTPEHRQKRLKLNKEPSEGLEGHCSWLPDECIHLFLAHLDDPKDWTACSAVNKQWLAVTNAYRTSLFAKDYTLLDRLVARFPNLTRLDLSACRRYMTSQMLPELVSVPTETPAPHVRPTEAAPLPLFGLLELSLKSLHVLNQESLRSILDIAGKTLRKLEAAAIGIPIEVALVTVASTCQMLVTLDLSGSFESEGHAEKPAICGAEFSDWHPLALLARACPKLENLNLSYHGWVNKQALAVLGQHCPPNLWSLHLRHCRNVGDTALLRLLSPGRCGLLREIDLLGCARVTSTGLSKLATSCTQLETLHVTAQLPTCEQGMTSIATHCRMLRVVEMDGICRSSNAIISLAQGLGPQLVELRLQHPYGISQIGLGAVKTHCTNLAKLEILAGNSTGMGLSMGAGDLGCVAGGEALEVLSFCGPNWMQENPLSQVASTSPKLRQLNLRSMEGIGRRADPFAGTWQSLQQLCLRNSGTIDVHALESLGKHCKVLLTLDVGECPLVDDVGLAHLAAGCLKLEHLLLDKCPLVTGLGFQGAKLALRVLCLDYSGAHDSGLTALSAACPSLSCLSLWACKAVTVRGVKALATSCKELKVLDLQGCHDIEEAALERASKVSSFRTVTMPSTALREGVMTETESGFCKFLPAPIQTRSLQHALCCQEYLDMHLFQCRVTENAQGN